MNELQRLKEAMFKIVDKSSDREEDFAHAIKAGQVVLDAIISAPYPGEKEADELRAKLGRLESKVERLKVAMYGSQSQEPAAPVPDENPTPVPPPAAPAEPIRVGPPVPEAPKAAKDAKSKAAKA